MKKLLCFILCFSIAINIILPSEKADGSSGVIKVLAIGNSFSEDAVEYLEKMAAADGVTMLVGNLYIGGCSLATHWQNAGSDANAYTYYEFSNGNKTTKSSTSIKTILEKEDWDYVTFQQVSQNSGQPATFEPFLSNLSSYVYKLEPNAEQLLHQTWAYEIDSTHGGFGIYNKNQETMYKAITDTYNKYSEIYGFRIIPSGEAMQRARATAPFDYKKGGLSLCRDGFHANTTHGRYLLSAVWYEVFTGKSILDSKYSLSGIKADQLSALKTASHEAVAEYSKALVQSIELKTKPTKVIYFPNEAVNVNGGKLTVKYTDGSSKELDLKPNMLANADTKTIGNATIKLRYGNKIVSFDVSIISRDNVTAVETEIGALDLNNLDVDKVNTAKEHYDALTPNEQEAVSNYSKLVKALKALSPATEPTKAPVKESTAKKPTASPAAGKTYKKDISVKLITSEKNATIYYTTNGKTPTTKTTKYTKVIKITKTTTIKAIVVVKGKKNSPIATFKYTIKK